jgi:hypothetical protein
MHGSQENNIFESSLRGYSSNTLPWLFYVVTFLRVKGRFDSLAVGLKGYERQCEGAKKKKRFSFFLPLRQGRRGVIGYNYTFMYSGRQ